MGVGRRTDKTEWTQHPRREYFYSHLTTKIRMIITTDEGTTPNRMSFPWIRGYTNAVPLTKMMHSSYPHLE